MDEAQIIASLKRKPGTVGDLAAALGGTKAAAGRILRDARARGLALHERNGAWHLDTQAPLGTSRDKVAEMVTGRDGWLHFGAIGDSHLGSKYARLDCLEDYYSEAEARGIKTVLHAGNWIDGDAPFNRHDLDVHGMDAQIQYLADKHPRRPGMQTWAITGADHEGWYARREGVDIGRYAENAMRQAGRTDWRDMGYMETYIRLKHPTTGASAMLCLMHPGGGSAYAISYAPQKIVEGFDGADKPAVLLIGHYHKASYQLTRNVHTIQVGCFEDQTVFMRQKKLSAHLGGMFVGVRLDPQTGAVVECQTTFRSYAVQTFYTGRWSQHGPAVNPPRKAPGVATRAKNVAGPATEESKPCPKPLKRPRK